MEWNGIGVKFNSGSNKVWLLSIIRPSHYMIGIQIIAGRSGLLLLAPD